MVYITFIDDKLPKRPIAIITIIKNITSQTILCSGVSGLNLNIFSVVFPSFKKNKKHPLFKRFLTDVFLKFQSLTD